MCPEKEGLFSSVSHNIAACPVKNVAIADIRQSQDSRRKNRLTLFDLSMIDMDDGIAESRLSLVVVDHYRFGLSQRLIILEPFGNQRQRSSFDRFTDD